MRAIISAAAILALATVARAEDSGVLRGTPDEGTTKRILRTQADGTLLMDIPKLSTGATGALRMELVNETDPEVGTVAANFVPRWDGPAAELVTGSIFDNGNIGIGTTAPGQKLEVVGTVKATAFQGDGSQLTGIGTGLGGSGTAGTISKWTGATSLGNSVILETAGGNVGIGTGSPSQKLEVAGTVKATAFQGDGSGLTGLPSGGASFKVGFFTREQSLPSGTQAITGVGFQPKAVLFFSVQHDTSEASWGMDDGSTARAVRDGNSQFPGAYGRITYSIHALQTAVDVYAGNILSMDPDGFTINWVRAGSPTGEFTVAYLAMR